MRAVIIGNGDIRDYNYIKSKLRSDDYIICADGGLRHLEKLDIKADIAIGDFDSAEQAFSVKTLKYPIDKDYTDSELALEYALKSGYSEILMLAVTGTRLDHTITNIMLLTKSDNVSIIDDKNEIFALRNKLTLEGRINKTLSVIPITQKLEGVTSKGLKYKLDNDTLYFATGRGNSNLITDNECVIMLKSGIGIVIINDGE